MRGETVKSTLVLYSLNLGFTHSWNYSAFQTNLFEEDNFRFFLNS